MLNVWQANVVDESGDVIPAAVVEVRDQATLTLVSIFSDVDGNDPLANPFAADGDGFAQFYVEQGRYRVRATASGFIRTWSDVIIGLPFSEITLPALSVVGNAVNTEGAATAVAAGNNNEVLRRASNVLAFGQVVYADIANASACSVLGRATNSSGVLADIQAGTNDRVLARTSDVVSFVQLTAGMFPNTVVPDAALSANVPLLDEGNVFEASQEIRGAIAALTITETGATADEGRWQWRADGDELHLYTLNDAGSAVRDLISITRNGTDALIFQLGGVGTAELEFNAALLDFNGASDFSSTITAAGVIGATGTNSVIQSVGSNTAQIRWENTAAATDQKWWMAYVDTDGIFRLSPLQDDLDVGTGGIALSRTADSVTAIAITAATLDFNGPIDPDLSRANGVGYLGVPVIDGTGAGSFTLNTGHVSQTILLASGAAVTIPANSTTAFPIGTTINLKGWAGSGSYSVVPAGGVTLYWSGTDFTTGTRTLSGGLADVTLQKLDTDIWSIAGVGIS